MCMFNKLVNVEQIIVQFNVADLKILHNNKDVLDDFLDELRSKFGQEDKLMENKRLVHEYLGIIIYYLIAGKVVFTMFDSLQNMIAECAEDLKKLFLLS